MYFFSYINVDFVDNELCHLPDGFLMKKDLYIVHKLWVKKCTLIVKVSDD